MSAGTRRRAGAPLLIVASSSVPNVTANALQAVKTAHALARSGIRVSLVAKQVLPAADPDQVLAHYGLEPIETLRMTLVRVGPGRHRNRVFFGRLVRTPQWRGPRLALFTREPRVVALSRLTGPRAPVVYETHELADLPGRMLNRRSRVLQRWALRSADGVVTVTRGGAEQFADRGVDPDRILVAPNGADAVPAEPARERLDGEILLAYVGSLVEDRGVDVLVRALARLDDRIVMHVVGPARPHEERSLRELAAVHGVTDRVRILPGVPHAEVPSVLQAADVLVLPMRRSAIGETFASPIKLFEYMAARRPIIASDLPTVRELVGEDEAWFFRPDDDADLARAVGQVVERWPQARRRAEAARSLLERSYTYDARASALVAFLRDRGILPS